MKNKVNYSKHIPSIGKLTNQSKLTKHVTKSYSNTFFKKLTDEDEKVLKIKETNRQSVPENYCFLGMVLVLINIENWTGTKGTQTTYR